MDLSNQKRIIFLGIAVAIIFAFCFLAIKIEKRIERQNIRAAEVKVTIPEGFNISNIENTLAFKLPNFKKDKFLLEAEKKEGYLFPDTYFFLLADDGSKAIQTMSDNFVKKISIVLPEINLSGKTENEII